MKLIINKKFVAFITLILIMTIWATTFFIIKSVVTELDPMLLVFSRTAIAALIMFFILIFKNTKVMYHKSSMLNGLAIGFLIGISYLSQTIGLKYTSSGHSAFISCSSVILVPVILFVVFKEKINTIDLISLIITITGLFLLTYNLNTKINYGDAITSISMFAFAIIVVYQSRILNSVNIPSFLFYEFIGASFIGLFGLIFNYDFSIQLSLKSSMVILYLSIFATLFCFIAMAWVLKYLIPFFVALLISIEPILAAVFAYFTLGEILNTKELIGAIIVIAGIILYQMKYYKSLPNNRDIEFCKCK